MTTATAISDYLLNRVADNAQWYHAKGALQSEFIQPKKHAVLFELFFAILTQALGDGHTVLTINQTADDELAKRLSVGRPLWQANLVTQAVWILNEPFVRTKAPAMGYSLGNQSEREQSFEPFDFLEMINSFDDFKLDNATLANLLNAHKQRYTLALQNHARTLKAGELDELLSLFVCTVRACFILATSCHSLDELAEFLARVVYFGKADAFGEQLDGVLNGGLDNGAKSYPTINPPIIYHKNCHKNCQDGQADSISLWLNRAYRAEFELMNHIRRLSAGAVTPFSLERLSDLLNPEQRAAVALVAKQAFGIITGGPGTGKTFTVAQIVLAMTAGGQNIRLALSAPTGKAAQRMSESLQAALEGQMAMSLPEPKTIHRLLGIGAAGLPRHNEQNPLPYDVIIVDEASMLGVELACQLLSAVRTGTRLILLGDANQLAAVDAGAVLSDLCAMPSLADHQVRLVQSRRFDEHSGVGRLARLIQDEMAQADTANHQTDQTVFELIARQDDVRFIPTNSVPYDEILVAYERYFALTKRYHRTFAALDLAGQNDALAQMMDALGQYRILCASHQGAFGDLVINAHISQHHRTLLNLPASAVWYHGRVVMITKNRYDLGLFNGDVGICVRTQAGLMVYFEGRENQAVSVAMLDEQVATTAYAITVHKSQGSEWQTVAIVFDGTSERLLSKELIYTAVTRAKKQVHIYSDSDSLLHAISTPTVRQTGLQLVENIAING